MKQIQTNYTTYDLAYYYADLARLPRLSREERQQLTTLAHEDAEARNRLIEDHLRLATRIAIDRCPPAFYRSFPDIIGEVSLTLVKVAHRYDFQAGGDFTNYVIGCTEGAVKRIIETDRLIRIPSSTLSRARQQGSQESLYQLQPKSLDELTIWYDLTESEEPPVSSLLSTSEAPPRDESLRAQVQTWLSYLSERAQQVLTLRYGLADDNERAHTAAEIRQLLGLSRSELAYLERDAMHRIQALVEGRGTIIEKDGRKQVTRIYTYTPPTLTAEQETTLMQACTRLRQQGITPNARMLARQTGIAYHRTRVFMRQLLPEGERTLTRQEQKEARDQARKERLAQACQQLEAQGRPVTGTQVAALAHVKKTTAHAFVHAWKEAQTHANS